MRHTFLVALGLVTLAAATFGGWWLQDVRVEASWNPDWPRAVRITAEAVEKIVVADGCEISAGDRARAAERARWKAYYYAQLRAAEQLGDLEIAAETSIRELTEMDQELRASFAGALRAAAEIDSATELLDDSVKARVTVEIPAEPMRDLKTVIAEALRAGRIAVERRPRPDEPPVVASPEPLPEDTAAPPAIAAVDPESAALEEPGPRPAAETLTEPLPAEELDEAPEIAAGDRARRPPPPAPTYTGAAVRLGESPNRLGVTSVLYELGGTEIGTVLDLPPERLTAGFFPVADPSDSEAIERLAGPSPRDLEATVSDRDLFLTERLNAEEVRQLRQWLRAGKVVLLLG